MKLDLTPTTASAEEASKKEASRAAMWLDEIVAAKKREKDFRKEGARLVPMYEGAKKSEYQFNILYSNTETFGPALYNSVPRPVVQRRFKDEDPLGKAAAQAGQHILEYLVDDGIPEYATFDELMKSSVLEALVPGRGLACFKYEATIEQAQMAAQAEAAEVDGQEEDETEKAASAPEEVTFETVCGEEVPWDRFLHGYAKKWKDVPWIAYEYLMTKEELEKNLGAIAALIPVSEPQQSGGEEDESKKAEAAIMAGVKVAPVYAIWDKLSKMVIFVSPSLPDRILKEVSDPLKLSGFFNCPKPLAFAQKISTLAPVALYTFYEEQAKELNRITVRINKIINALKVRGMYDSTVDGLDKVLQADDNVLVPAENVAALLANGNALEKAIWLFPIEKLIPVLQQLYVQRDQIKQVIFEITGLADIMRGSSQASETLGAQELKNQWGTLRLKRLQKEVARYARDCLRLMLEIAVNKLSEDTLQGMTGLPYPTGSQKAQAELQLQQMQVGGFAPPPELAQLLAQPSWTDILSILRNDLQRSYRIDIETNSTVDAEATEDKQNIAELLNAISQFLNGVAPLVEQGAMPFEVAQGMLLAIVRRFRFGPELEDQLKNMKAPQPKTDPKVEAAQMKAKQDQEKHALDMQRLQAELEMDRERMQMEREKMQMELQMERERVQLELASLRNKAALGQQQHQQRLQQMAAQAAMAATKPAGVTQK